MAAYRNPFTPTFGIVPPHLAGRSQILADMAQAFDDGPGNPNLSTILVGARGCGKTALLLRIAEEARRCGWVTVAVAAGPGMLDDILERTLEAAGEFVEPPSKRRLTGLNVAQILGLEWTLEPSGSANWRTKMNAVFAELERLDIGLLISVDEVDVGVDEVVRLATSYQLFIGEGKKVALAMAGLPKNVTDLVEDDRVSFLRRSRRRMLGRIPAFEVADALRQTVEEAGKRIDGDALWMLAEAARGFAYMVQLVGYAAWSESGSSDVITSEHVQRGIALAKAEFRRGVLDTTYREMSAGDRAFAKALLECGTPARLTDVAARMGRGTNYASTYKKRLMKQGIIEEGAGTTLEFAIPGLDEYLRELA